MEKISVAQARQEAAIGKEVLLQGWVRTRRDSKGGFSFLEINDGSCQGNVQVVAEAKLANYESEIKKLGTGCAASPSRATVRASPAKGQATEIHAGQSHRPRLGRPEDLSDAEEGTSPSSSCAPSPICGRAPTPSAPSPGCATACAGRSTISSRNRAFSTSIRRSSPPATAKGPGRCSASPRSTRPSRRSTERRSRLQQGLLRQADLPDRQRPARSGDLRLRPGQGLHLRADLPGRELEHLAPPGRVLDGRAGNGLLRSARQHDPGRGVPQTHHPRRPGALRRGHAVLRGTHRKEA